MNETKTCATCKYRWFGSFTPRMHFARWWCRKPKLHDKPVMIGEGSDKDLQAAKGCREWDK